MRDYYISATVRCSDEPWRLWSARIQADSMFNARQQAIEAIWARQQTYGELHILTDETEVSFRGSSRADIHTQDH